jgi:hypothetical protein
MNIHWRNIGILIFVIIIAFLLLRHGPAVSGVVDDLGRIGPGHTNDEKTVGLLALGFIGVSLVAIVRLLTRNGPSDRHDRRRDPPED